MPNTQDLLSLKIGNADGWSFLNGPWRDGDAGELMPPEAGTGAFMAVAHRHEYADFQARLRFRFRNAHAGARFVFRLQDATRYYALDIPWCGQQNRNRHMWAGLLIADGTPLQRYLDFKLIPEVVPRHEYWYEARVACVGSRIRAWIEGRLIADLEDPTYPAGRIGVMAVTACGGGGGVADFAAAEVEGTPVGPSCFEGLTAPTPHWITPCAETDPETHQSYPSIIRSQSGELTAGIHFGNPNFGEVRRTVWVRSRDAGRTWSPPEPATLQLGFGCNFVKQDGTWVTLHVKPDGSGPQAYCTYESPDEGRTWKGPEPIQIVGDWPKELKTAPGPSGQPLRLRDGTMLVPLMCQREFVQYIHAKVSTNYVLRSTDDGKTWAAPVWCDSNNSVEGQWFSAGNFSEMGLAEAEDNVVIGYGRPGPWPYMWRIRSNDGGKTWEPASFGAFPGYCSTLTRTASGALVAVHRFPYMGANVSHDDGVTWDAGTIVDYPLWANHQAVEVEPDVVLVNYMGYIAEPGQADRRVVRLRVTEHGLEIAS